VGCSTGASTDSQDATASTAPVEAPSPQPAKSPSESPSRTASFLGVVDLGGSTMGSDPLSLSEDGARIVTGRSRVDDDVIIVDVPTLEVIKAFSVPDVNHRNYAALLMDEDSVLVLASEYDYDSDEYPAPIRRTILTKFDPGTGEPSDRLNVPKRSWGLRTLPDDTALVFADASVSVVNGVTMQKIGSIDVPASGAQDCGDGRLALVDDESQLFHLVDKANWSVLTTVKLEGLSDVSGGPPGISPECARVAGRTPTGGFALIDARTGAILAKNETLPDYSGAIAQPRFDPVTGDIFVSSYSPEEGFNVYILDSESLEVVETLENEGLAALADGPYCIYTDGIVVSADGTTLAISFNTCGDSEDTDFAKIAIYGLRSR